MRVQDNPKSPSRAHASAAVVLALVCMIAACGDDSSPSPGDGNTSTNNATTSTNSATTSAPNNDAGLADTGDDAGDAGEGDVGGADAAPDVPLTPTVDLAPPDPNATPFDYCDGQPPDLACYASKRDPESERIALARAIADKLLEEDPTTLRWDWGEAVMMVGLAQLWKVTGDARYLSFIQAWMDHHIDTGYEIVTSDTSASAALAVFIMDAGGDPARYRPVVDDALVYLREEAARTPEGALSHFGTLDLFDVMLWADSLFMFGNIFTWWGERSGEVQALDDYVEQYSIFADLMQQPPGFFRHAADQYPSVPFPQDPGIYWARANGWILAAAYDHLRVRRARGEALPEMEASARQLAEAVAGVQDAETGLWWNILNRPDEIYLETSASALFAVGLARAWRYGYVSDAALPIIAAAVDGVRAQITEDDEGRPVITGISAPTSVGPFDYYAQLPQGDDISYGIGAVLLMLTETSGLPSP